MRYELYSLRCERRSARNAPDRKTCVGCGGALQYIRRCFHCQNENPPNAYVCLTCYRVLKQKPPVGFVHWRLPWGVSVLVMVVVVGGFVYQLFRSWLDYAEAQFESEVVSEQRLELQRREMEARHHE